VVLERAGAPGGAAAMSDGFIYLGGGTPEQREAGFADSVENMRTFLTAACGPAPDLEKIDAYCTHSLEHREWLLARGVRFLGTVVPEANGTSPIDGEGLMFTGGENAWPYDEIATPAPRGHVVQGGRPGGSVLRKLLAAAAEDAGATTGAGHPRGTAGDRAGRAHRRCRRNALRDGVHGACADRRGARGRRVHQQPGDDRALRPRRAGDRASARHRW
jgi:hypothetical protein